MCHSSSIKSVETIYHLWFRQTWYAALLQQRQANIHTDRHATRQKDRTRTMNQTHHELTCQRVDLPVGDTDCTAYDIHDVRFLQILLLEKGYVPTSL
jgi:hypothetical protein